MSVSRSRFLAVWLSLTGQQWPFSVGGGITQAGLVKGEVKGNTSTSKPCKVQVSDGLAGVIDEK
jgi:hypothetical protein